MKLLLDQNLSPRLVALLGDLYPGSQHVQPVGLDRASDDALWSYAKNNLFVIVTKDEDFNDLSIMRGFPPKILWLQLGNCTTAQIETALRSNYSLVEAFNADSNAGTLVLR